MCIYIYIHIIWRIYVCICIHFCRVGQTVGYKNYRYFFLFLFNVFLCNSYGFSMTFLPFLKLQRYVYLLKMSCFTTQWYLSNVFIHVCILNLLYRSEMEVTPMTDVATVFSISSVFTVCLAGGVAVGFLLGWHIYLVVTNQTTGEIISFHTCGIYIYTFTYTHTSRYDMT